MVSLPLVFAPFRALIGFVGHSPLGARLAAGALYLDGHAAAVRRLRHHAVRAARAVGRHGDGPAVIGHIGAALAFLLVGAGLHTTQTAGLALATDLAPDDARPRVVAFLYVMLLIGMVASALIFGALLADFDADPADPGDPGRRGRARWC